MEKFPLDELGREKGRAALSLLKEGLKKNKRLDLEVTTNSMSPLLEAGDRVSIKDIAKDKLRRGDIIVFEKDGSLYAHRSIRFVRSPLPNEDYRLITKGDNAPYLDEWLVSPKELFGKVISIKKRCGRIDLENRFWRVNNYMMAVISYLEAYAFKFFRRIKKAFWRDEKAPFVIPAKKALSSLSRAFIRAILSIRSKIC